MANKHIKRCLRSYFIRQMQIKNTISFYIFCKARKQTITNVGKNVKKWELSSIAGENGNGTATLGNNLAVS